MNHLIRHVKLAWKYIIKIPLNSVINVASHSEVVTVCNCKVMSHKFNM